MDLQTRFGSSSPLIGMVHLPPLPGAPGFDGDRGGVRERALSDAHALIESGFDAVLVENYGDVPYYPEDVPDHVVAEMAAVARELGIDVDCPFGVNVLRNDVGAALSVAAAAGGSFVRANVHSGTRATDQGVIEGTAHETLRLRERIDADVAVLADVAVKHSAPVAERGLATAATEAIERGLADGLVVSGPATGQVADADDLTAVVEARDGADPDVPVFVGSGATPENAPALLDSADGLVVGTALKEGGETDRSVDLDRAEAFVDAVRGE